MDKTQFQPQNADALFSPDQWLNQFSNFNNAALPWPSSYAGMPTDAMGNPIQPPPGMTINSAPQAPAAPAQPQASQGYASAMPVLQGMPAASNAAANSNPMMAQLAGWQALQYPQLAKNGNMFGDSYLNMISGQGGGQTAASSAPAASAGASGPTYPQILSMLANPGKVNTPGATVPETASVQPGSANLQSFLKNWQPAQSGPGSGFQQNFSTALKGMGY